MVLIQQTEERPECALTKHVISALGRVTGNVSESPHGLFADIDDWRVEKLDEDGHRACFNHDLSVIRSTGSNVCQSPGSFKLSELRRS